MNTQKPQFSKFNKRIILEFSNNQYEDNIGFFQQNWEFFRHTWASVEIISAKEKYQLGRLEQKYSHRITTRYIESPNLNLRARYMQKIFRIKWCTDYKESKKFLIFYAEEEIENGML